MLEQADDATFVSVRTAHKRAFSKQREHCARVLRRAVGVIRARRSSHATRGHSKFDGAESTYARTLVSAAR